MFRNILIALGLISVSPIAISGNREQHPSSFLERKEEKFVTLPSIDLVSYVENIEKEQIHKVLSYQSLCIDPTEIIEKKVLDYLKEKIDKYSLQKKNKSEDYTFLVRIIASRDPQKGRINYKFDEKLETWLGLPFFQKKIKEAKKSSYEWVIKL